MKEWKKTLVDNVVSATKTDRIVSLKEKANEAGITHISAQDTRDIVNAVLKVVPDYKAVQMVSTPNDSLFCSVCFVDKTTEFDD